MFETEINLLNSDPIPDFDLNLPDKFSFKTLDTSYLDQIHQLLNEHYIEDDYHTIRLTYSRDFLYWYLRTIPSGFIVGLIFKNKLVGLVTAMFIDYFINDSGLKLPYIDLLCIQTPIRNYRFSLCLINEINQRLIKNGFNYAFFTTSRNPSNPPQKEIIKKFCISVDHAIPIDHKHLKEVGFLTIDLDPIPILDNNPLHFLHKSDLSFVTEKLNQSLSKYKMRPYFTLENAHHFLIPKKNIVYSFVNRNTDNVPTDFVNVYVQYYHCIEIKKDVCVANLGFYYTETMDLNQLITYLIDKLPYYGVHQLTYRNISDNLTIKHFNFETNGELNYYFSNLDVEPINNNDVSVFPF
jgi:glycylpeptide N-tetradecanoyltransferase